MLQAPVAASLARIVSEHSTQATEPKNPTSAQVSSGAPNAALHPVQLRRHADQAVGLGEGLSFKPLVLCALQHCICSCNARCCRCPGHRPGLGQLSNATTSLAS